MKIYLLPIIKYAFVAIGMAASAGPVAADGIRIVPRSIQVKNDSIHLYLEMDLNSIHVNSLTAIIFTPELKATSKASGWLQLPPVVISGSKRFGFERRERALAVGKTPPAVPYLVLLESKRTGAKNIRYRVAVPYASWMQHASLLLRQELKDCCDLQLLGVDTLTQRLALMDVPASPVSPAPSVPVLDAGPQKSRPVPTPLYTASASATPRRTEGQGNAQVSAPVSSIQFVTLNTSEVNTYAAMVSFLTPGPGQISKQRSKNTTLYIDYPLGKDEVYPDFMNNREEIGKIDACLLPLLSEGYSEIEQIRVKGYASPDGPYGDNEKLAANRSRLFARYVQQAYGIPARLFDVSSVAEDWDGVENLLLQTKPSYYQAAIDIIHRYGIFSGREKQLMDLRGGVPYKDMLKQIFPRLRRIELTVNYRIRSLNAGEASEMIYTHPDLLSLEEIYGVAAYYRPGTDQYREVYEVAAFHFPDDVVANVNAASAVMLTGDLKSAWEYLRKIEADPRAWNNMGVLNLMEGNPEGAAIWFRKAVGIEPRKARKNLQIAEGTMGN